MVARDDASNSGTLDVTVTVTDQNEGPEILGTTEPLVHREPDYGPGPGHLHRHRPRGPGRLDNALEPDGHRRRRLHHRRERPADLQERAGPRDVRPTPGRDNVYNLSVRASDGRNYGYLEVTVTVQDVNEPPVGHRHRLLSLTGRTAPPPCTPSGPPTPNGAAITWSVTGTDRDDFAISETGVLSFANPPTTRSPADSDRDNVYEVTVVARDDAFNSGTLDVAVTVTDQNEGPEISGQQSLSFTENHQLRTGFWPPTRRRTLKTRLRSLPAGA